ncbi:MAG TPA: hypothetical protein VEY13_15405 [Rubrobacteraceae bacterium]|nr:hypothetical protein [Rubrobacteraceae bacterium]
MVTASTGRGRTTLAAAGLILVLFLVSLGAISNGFLFVLVASVFAVAAAVLMENLHLTEKPTAHNPPENLADEVAVGISTGTSTSLPREPRQNPTGEPGR